LAVLYYAKDSNTVNQIFKDCITFYQSRVISQYNKYVPKVGVADINNPNVKNICD
jgi:hypothetical protein